MPRIVNSGLTCIMQDQDTLQDTHSSVVGTATPRWSAPELLDLPMFSFGSCWLLKEPDCHSKGMTIYEVRCMYYIR